MVYEYTPLHSAAIRSDTDSVKTILELLQLQLMSVQSRAETAILLEELKGHTDTERVLTEYQQRAERLQKQKEQSRLHKSLSGKLS